MLTTTLLLLLAVALEVNVNPEVSIWRTPVRGTREGNYTLLHLLAGWVG
jgi:hypothetical protein